MSNNPTNSPLNIAIAVYSHLLVTSLTLPIEMLRAGEAFAKGHTSKQHFRALNIHLIAKNMAPIATRTGLAIVPDCSSDNAPYCDLIIVPGIWRNPRPVVKTNQPIVNWLNESFTMGSHIIGVGTGNCLLAEAGLLDGHPATTHWHYAKQFSQDYPNVSLKPDFFITQSERLYTVASLNALADVIVHIISQYYGKEAAQHVERNFSHEIRKPYEDQRYLEGAVNRHADELIAQIQFWLKTNLSSELDLQEVAAQFSLSYRTFTRRFRLATNQSPIEYWQQLRVEGAKELLASSNLSIQEVALEVGYNDQGHLTRVFKKVLSQTPSEYRKVVRRKLFG
ncbi:MULTISPECIES: GlxA family transcriptional regulator [unclassified Pseudoalteromonas]|uniref:GlxA family transcriptional regulator n=1 Tax=unclassified Pseudoalteromonas TaxID=194690 RepID=UPI00110A126F|nr:MULTISPECIES: helix-turn-helix domain-containing protein [unclassified Pseudoalteromonas]MCK8102920.1 helix-turn-helix domain-containing protein [Pseudoalteromonas sp. 2CM36K]MCK8131738.1 helix-turn-helix domain-containing protein [Pseudoalteromonas sp. 2CM28B]TMO25342.1 AraC family transcriptional regulator [Pseudoalteromonas sp. S4741]